MAAAFRLIVVMLSCLGVAIACSVTKTAWREVGTYSFRNQQCDAILKISSQGGFTQLYVQLGNGRVEHVADDITGVVWIDRNSLAFSSSPIYGKPGIFILRCSQPTAVKLMTLVAPTHMSRTYPEGTDYFELKERKGMRLEYFFSEDVDNTDFSMFHTNQNLRSVVIPMANE